MKPLAECLSLIQGRSIEEFTQENPSPVLIGLGVIAGELQRNPAKAAGTMFLNLGGAAGGAESDQLVNQTFNIEKVSQDVPADGVYIGSALENDIVIPDSSVSKSHAHFVIEGDECALIDHGSTNGTFVNGTRVEPNRPHRLKGGDILTIGRFSFTYYDALSFAKLLAVQAMARGRKRNRPRTPASSRRAAAPGGSTGGITSGRVERAPHRAGTDHRPHAGGPPGHVPGQPAMRPPRTHPPGEAGHQRTPTGPSRFEQRVSAWGAAAQPASNPPEDSGSAGAYPRHGAPAHGYDARNDQSGRHPRHEQPMEAQGGHLMPDESLPAVQKPRSWFARLMLRLSNWLRKMAGA